MTDFKGKAIVVTGGARGQGAAHTRYFAEHGGSVYCLDIRDELGEALQEELRGEGLDVAYRHHDVTSPKDWSALAELLAAQHGTLDVLINNAGIVHTCDLAAEDLDRFENVMRVNATGVFLGMKSCWSLLESAGGGAIVNVASVYGLRSNPGYVAYTASKAAVIGMTRTAAIEGARAGIRVNAVSPGTVRTAQLEDEGKSYVRDATPMDRGADPAEISRAVGFLASSDASFITGTELIVDGGFCAH